MWRLHKTKKEANDGQPQAVLKLFSLPLMISCSTTSHLCSLLSGFFQHEPGQGVFWWSQHHRLPDHQLRQHHRPAVPPALGTPGWKRISRSQKHSTEGQWRHSCSYILFSIFKDTFSLLLSRWVLSWCRNQRKKKCQFECFQWHDVWITSSPACPWIEGAYTLFM